MWAVPQWRTGSATPFKKCIHAYLSVIRSISQAPSLMFIYIVAPSIRAICQFLTDSWQVIFFDNYACIH